MEDKIKQVASWLQEQVEKNPYGETGVNLIIHNSKIIRIETGTREKCA